MVIPDATIDVCLALVDEVPGQLSRLAAFTWEQKKILEAIIRPRNVCHNLR